MSNINADTLNSINATITNLIIETINGRHVNRFFNDCLCQDDDGLCPECIPYKPPPAPGAIASFSTIASFSLLFFNINVFVFKQNILVNHLDCTNISCRGL